MDLVVDLLFQYASEDSGDRPEPFPHLLGNLKIVGWCILSSDLSQRLDDLGTILSSCFEASADGVLCLGSVQKCDVQVHALLTIALLVDVLENGVVLVERDFSVLLLIAHSGSLNSLVARVVG